MGLSGLMIRSCVLLLPVLCVSLLDSFSPEPRRPHTAPPIFEGEPFIVTWNIPNLTCNRYNVTLNTSPYRGVSNPAKVPGQFLALFYVDRLGLYPYVDEVTGKQFNGGVPQRGNLRASLAKAEADVEHYIPSRSSAGLAVIDWEDWRPLWERNWGSKRVYRSLSVTYARRRDPSLTARKAAAQARQRFQSAAKSYMLETLSLGARRRPDYLWGFYLFPNCYNYGWAEPGYTGECSREVRRQNNRLLWLWEASTALYPSVYLQASLAGRPDAALMVRHRVHEALRVAALPRRRRHTPPVYVYTRPVFVDQTKRLLSLGDLVHTIGESAAMGASGAVLWGASADYDDKVSCEALSTHLDDTINPYVANVTAAAKLCGDFLCKGKGRCVRRNFTSHEYLHLNPDSFSIQRSELGEFTVVGAPSLQDLMAFARGFTCQCYAGRNCDTHIPTPAPTETTTATTTTTTTPNPSLSYITSPMPTLTPGQTSTESLSQVPVWTTATLQTQTPEVFSSLSPTSDYYR